MNFPFNLSFGFKWKKSIQGNENHAATKNKGNVNISSNAPFIHAGKGIKAGGDIIIGSTTHYHSVQQKTERQLAQELVVFLENKRVLYAQHAWEVPTECIDSVMDMRRYLTDKINDTEDATLDSDLKKIRRACINFLSACTNHKNGHRDMRYIPRDEFEHNLSSFRQSVSGIILPLVVKYRLSVEPDLLDGLEEQK